MIEYFSTRIKNKKIERSSRLPVLPLLEGNCEGAFPYISKSPRRQQSKHANEIEITVKQSGLIILQPARNLNGRSDVCTAIRTRQLGRIPTGEKVPVFGATVQAVPSHRNMRVWLFELPSLPIVPTTQTSEGEKGRVAGIKADDASARALAVEKVASHIKNAHSDAMI